MLPLPLPEAPGFLAQVTTSPILVVAVVVAAVFLGFVMIMALTDPGRS